MPVEIPIILTNLNKKNKTKLGVFATTFGLVDNEKDALGSAFIDILNSIGVLQHVSGHTHCRNHTLDLILSH